ANIFRDYTLQGYLEGVEGLIEQININTQGGLSGIEVYYPFQDRLKGVDDIPGDGEESTKVYYFRKTAERLGKFMTTGTDWHKGLDAFETMGTGWNYNLNAPYSMIEQLQQAAARNPQRIQPSSVRKRDSYQQGHVFCLAGGAGVGKSTTLQELGRQLDLFVIPVGMIYRAIAYLAMQKGIDLDNPNQIAALARAALEQELYFFNDTEHEFRVHYQGQDITDAIKKDTHVAQVSDAIIHHLHPIIAPFWMGMTSDLTGQSTNVILDLAPSAMRRVASDRKLRIYLYAPKERVAVRLLDRQLLGVEGKSLKDVYLEQVPGADETSYQALLEQEQEAGVRHAVLNALTRLYEERDAVLSSKGNQVLPEEILQELMNNWEESLVFDTACFEGNLRQLAGLIIQESQYRNSILAVKKQQAMRLINRIYPQGDYPEPVRQFIQEKIAAPETGVAINEAQGQMLSRTYVRSYAALQENYPVLNSRVAPQIQLAVMADRDRFSWTDLNRGRIVIDQACFDSEYLLGLQLEEELTRLAHHLVRSQALSEEERAYEDLASIYNTLARFAEDYAASVEPEATIIRQAQAVSALAQHDAWAFNRLLIASLSTAHAQVLLAALEDFLPAPQLAVLANVSGFSNHPDLIQGILEYVQPQILRTLGVAEVVSGVENWIAAQNSLVGRYGRGPWHGINKQEVLLQEALENPDQPLSGRYYDLLVVVVDEASFPETEKVIAMARGRYIPQGAEVLIVSQPKGKIKGNWSAIANLLIEHQEQFTGKHSIAVVLSAGTGSRNYPLTIDGFLDKGKQPGLNGSMFLFQIFKQIMHYYPEVQEKGGMVITTNDGVKAIARDIDLGNCYIGMLGAVRHVTDAELDGLGTAQANRHTSMIEKMVEKAPLEERIRLYGQDAYIPTNWADYYISLEAIQLIRQLYLGLTDDEGRMLHLKYGLDTSGDLLESVTTLSREKYVQRREKKGWAKEDAEKIWDVSHQLFKLFGYKFVDTGAEAIFIDTGTNQVFFETLMELLVRSEDPARVEKARALRALLGLPEPTQKGHLFVGDVVLGDAVVVGEDVLIFGPVKIESGVIGNSVAIFGPLHAKNVHIHDGTFLYPLGEVEDLEAGSEYLETYLLMDVFIQKEGRRERVRINVPLSVGPKDVLAVFDIMAKEHLLCRVETYNGKIVNAPSGHAALKNLSILKTDGDAYQVTTAQGTAVYKAVLVRQQTVWDMKIWPRAPNMENRRLSLSEESPDKWSYQDINVYADNQAMWQFLYANPAFNALQTSSFFKSGRASSLAFFELNDLVNEQRCPAISGAIHRGWLEEKEDAFTAQVIEFTSRFNRSVGSDPNLMPVQTGMLEIVVSPAGIECVRYVHTHPCHRQDQNLGLTHIRHAAQFLLTRLSDILGVQIVMVRRRRMEGGTSILERHSSPLIYRQQQLSVRGLNEIEAKQLLSGIILRLNALEDSLEVRGHLKYLYAIEMAEVPGKTNPAQEAKPFNLDNHSSAVFVPLRANKAARPWEYMAIENELIISAFAILHERGLFAAGKGNDQVQSSGLSKEEATAQSSAVGVSSMLGANSPQMREAIFEPAVINIIFEAESPQIAGRFERVRDRMVAHFGGVFFDLAAVERLYVAKYLQQHPGPLNYKALVELAEDTQITYDQANQRFLIDGYDASGLLAGYTVPVAVERSILEYIPARVHIQAAMHAILSELSAVRPVFISYEDFSPDARSNLFLFQDSCSILALRLQHEFPGLFRYINATFLFDVELENELLIMVQRALTQRQTRMAFRRRLAEELEEDRKQNPGGRLSLIGLKGGLRGGRNPKIKDRQIIPLIDRYFDAEFYFTTPISLQSVLLRWFSDKRIGDMVLRAGPKEILKRLIVPTTATGEMDATESMEVVGALSEITQESEELRSEAEALMECRDPYRFRQLLVRISEHPVFSRSNVFATFLYNVLYLMGNFQLIRLRRRPHVTRQQILRDCGLSPALAAALLLKHSPRLVAAFSDWKLGGRIDKWLKDPNVSKEKKSALIEDFLAHRGLPEIELLKILEEEIDEQDFIKTIIIGPTDPSLVSALNFECLRMYAYSELHPSGAFAGQYQEAMAILKHGLAESVLPQAVSLRVKWSANSIHSPAGAEMPAEISLIPSVEPRVVLINLCSPEYADERQNPLAVTTLAGHLREKTDALVTVVDMDRYLTELRRADTAVGAGTVDNANLLAEAIQRVCDETLIYQPHIIGMTLKPGSIEVAKQVVRALKAAAPTPLLSVNLGLLPVNIIQEKIAPLFVFGGPLATFAYERLLNEPEFSDTLMVKGEGEKAMAQIVDVAFKHPDDFVSDLSLYRQVPNLAFKIGDRMITTHSCWMTTAELTVPGPEKAIEYYVYEGRSPETIEVALETSRGCVSGQCVFCTVKNMCGQGWRGFDIQRLLARIRTFAESGRRIFRIIDTQFAGYALNPVEFVASMDRLEAFADGILKINEDLGLTGEDRIRVVVFATRADSFCDTGGELSWKGERRQQVLGKLAAAGVEKILMGIESGSNTQLARYRKYLDEETIRESIRRVRQSGIRVEAELIFFDPLINMAQLRENIDFVREMQLYDTCYCIYIPMRIHPLTEIYRQSQEAGLLQANDFDLDTLSYPYRFKDPQVQDVYRFHDLWEKTLPAFRRLLRDQHRNLVNTPLKARLYAYLHILSGLEFRLMEGLIYAQDTQQRQEVFVRAMQ
ncbi:MAG: (d)CMP kinase, partial [Candidatus Omnitrophica bacterium]|nr:(d)CMP kinase [Candidatus Omnitrophota bacterium]